MAKYKDWDILEQLPDNWIIDKTVGSPIPYTVFITNGKSVINGQKRALLKVHPKFENVIKQIEEVKIIHAPKLDKEIDNYEFPAKTVNELARLKFKKHLLNDILFDLSVCEIENWDKKEYINELQNLLNEFKIN
jgi:hypothetical protein